MQVICTLPNCSTTINGKAFGPVEGVKGMVSEDLPDEIAQAFLKIPGYAVWSLPPEAMRRAGPPAQKSPTAASKVKPESAAEPKPADEAEAPKSKPGK